MSVPGEVVEGADWHRRVVDRSLRTATQRSIDRGSILVEAAAVLLERSNGDGFTVQDVAREAGQSLRTLYQYFESKDDLLLAVFEEAMRSYAGMIGDAVEGLTDPVERLAGALLAAIRLPEYSGKGINRVLARLRLQLAQIKPELVERSQAPVNSLFRDLVDAADAAGVVRVANPGSATFLLLAVNSAAITDRTLGSKPAHGQPTPAEVVTFCLRGLGAEVKPAALDRLAARLALPKKPISFLVRDGDRAARDPKEGS